MSVKFSNNGHSTLASSLTSSATSITVASGHGARFPSLTGSEYFYATLIDSSNNLEIVKVTARSSDVLTVTRAQESTTARAYAIGDRVELRVTAQGLVDVGTPAADSIVNSMIATDAVNADSIAANAVGASELNVSGNGSTGEYLESDGDGSFSWSTVTTSILKVSFITNNTRTSPGAATNLTWLTVGTFTKDNSSADSDIYIQGCVPELGENADALGCWLQVDTNSDPGDNQEVHKGVMRMPTNAGNHTGGTYYNVKKTGLGTGTHTIYVGQNNRSNTSDRPAVLNPNNSDESRLQQTASQFIIFEVAT